MPQHGDYDKDKNQIYCGYWMSPEEWQEIHKYAPSLSGFENFIQENVEEQYLLIKIVL